MEKIVAILTNFWTGIHSAVTRVRAHIYSLYRSKSTPVICGGQTLYFETYCSSIQKACGELGISIAPHQSKKPGRFTKWFLSLFFGWPWPVRMLVYNKGKRLDAIATTPEEMARLVQIIWDTSVAEQKVQRTSSRGLSSESAVRSNSHNEIIEQTDTKSKVITRIATPHKVERNVVNKESLSLDPIQIKEDTKKTVAGAIMDNSF